jgi:hypothetical protein
MKKWLLISSALILISALAYILLSNDYNIRNSIEIRNNPRGIYRAIADTANWKQWWPDTTINNHLHWPSPSHYQLTAITASTFKINIHTADFSLSSELLLIPHQLKYATLEWRTVLPVSLNPIKRIQNYFAFKKLSGDMQLLLKQLQQYYSDTAHLYQVAVRRDFVKDSTLVFTSGSFQSYPTTEQIYTMIEKLRRYIATQQAFATDSPMLHIYRNSQSDYLLKVAIPTNKPLPDSGTILYKWMLPHGNILVADITGGQHKAEQALANMDNYVHDFELASPAIPFFSLQTNRLAVPDSNKWKTTIYYPVMYYKD